MLRIFYHFQTFSEYSNETTSSLSTVNEHIETIVHADQVPQTKSIFF